MLGWFKKKKKTDDSTETQTEAVTAFDPPVQDAPDDPAPDIDALDAAGPEDTSTVDIDCRDTLPRIQKHAAAGNQMAGISFT